MSRLKSIISAISISILVYQITSPILEFSGGESDGLFLRLTIASSIVGFMCLISSTAWFTSIYKSASLVDFGIITAGFVFVTSLPGIISLIFFPSQPNSPGISLVVVFLIPVLIYMFVGTMFGFVAVILENRSTKIS